MKDVADTVTLELVGLEPATDLREIAELGYGHVCERGLAGVCGVRCMLYTGALIVGLTPLSYGGRYCYGTIEEAIEALAAWDGRRDPPGSWIKYKSRTEERIGPGCDFSD
jgi:hypothetical protein